MYKTINDAGVTVINTALVFFNQFSNLRCVGRSMFNAIFKYQNGLIMLI